MSGTELGLKFSRADGSWDVRKLDHWYYRHFLGNKEHITSGLQLPLKVQRNEWGTAFNLNVFYDRTKEQLLEVYQPQIFCPK